MRFRLQAGKYTKIDKLRSRAPVETRAQLSQHYHFTARAKTVMT